MKITRVEPILTASDVFVRIETAAGIVGYGDARNHFIPYSVEGMLRDVIPYLIGEDPIRHENPEALARVREHTDVPPTIGERCQDQPLWPPCFRCRSSGITWGAAKGFAQAGVP